MLLPALESHAGRLDNLRMTSGHTLRSYALPCAFASPSPSRCPCAASLDFMAVAVKLGCQVRVDHELRAKRAKSDNVSLGLGCL